MKLDGHIKVVFVPIGLEIGVRRSAPRCCADISFYWIRSRFVDLLLHRIVRPVAKGPGTGSIRIGVISQYST